MPFVAVCDKEGFKPTTQLSALSAGLHLPGTAAKERQKAQKFTSSVNPMPRSGVGSKSGTLRTRLKSARADSLLVELHRFLKHGRGRELLANPPESRSPESRSHRHVREELVDRCCKRNLIAR